MRIKVKSVFFVVSSWDDRYVYSSERIEGGASEPVFRLSFKEAIAEADRRAGGSPDHHRPGPCLGVGARPATRPTYAP